MNNIDFKQIIHPGEESLSKEDLRKIINGPIAAGEQKYQEEINKKIFLFDLSKIVDVEIDGIDTKDYPDFCNAYVSKATYKDGGCDLTEDELEYLNNNHRDWVYEKIIDWIY